MKKRPLGYLRSFTAKIELERPEPWVLVNTGIFMLSLYGSLTGLPDTLGVIAFISLLISAAVGIYCFLRSV